MTKGNDGAAARRRLTKQIIFLSLGFSILIGMLVVLGVLEGRPRDNARLRNTPTNTIKQSFEQAGHHVRQVMQRQLAHLDEATLMKKVLAAEFELVDLTVVESELLTSPPNTYDGVYGEFCQLDWSKRKKDPSAVPMFRDLVAGSEHCQQHKFTLNLRKVVDLARHQDEAREKQGMPKILNFTAATFHESRCGSTLVANAVAAMDAAKHRSYSEAQAPAAALRSVCGQNYSRCSKQQAATVFSDVIYLMSRSKDAKEERVFFKFQSATTSSLEIFQIAFPDIPWMFVYRDPVQVMMSHIKDDPTLSGRANCLRGHQMPPTAIQEIAKQHGRKDARELTREEYCAAHLAAITEAAVNNLTPLGIPVDYANLPDILYTTILPKIFGRPLDDVEVDNIQQISQTYSKGRGSRHKAFTGDSGQKAAAATPAVQEAARTFLLPSFERLSQHRPAILQ